uniref:Sushi domain-containing protein n=1 Tax=Cyclopterus lumpus TaxID=8103 RepID=A0A8C2WVA2_CYCLU
MILLTSALKMLNVTLSCFSLYCIPLSHFFSTAGHCDSPDPIVNGHISGDGSSYRDTVVYQCMLGYRLIGTSVRICQQDHRWSGTTPVCVLIQCGPPPQVHHGKVEGTDHSWGSSVGYSCFHGYQLSTPAVLSCEGNGTWTGDDCGIYTVLNNDLRLTASVASSTEVIKC